jgi:hypothetical protein
MLSTGSSHDDPKFRLRRGPKAAQERQPAAFARALFSGKSRREDEIRASLYEIQREYPKPQAVHLLIG